jgi:transglutaminase-like putative cysteine protease
VLEHRLDVAPGAAVRVYRDYWGTWVCAFDLHEPHDSLTISSCSLVETGLAGATVVPEGSVPSWKEVAAAPITDRWCEYLAPTEYVPLGDDVQALVEPWRTTPDPVSAVRAAQSWIVGEMRYARGSTTVGTTASEALRQRRGVCQDFAHLYLAFLRALRIPARYVSGYSLPQDDTPVGATVAGESHAWVEVWLGEWVPLDPTTGHAVVERHVVVAHGRDYADVPPLKGVYHGGTAGALDVSVQLTRVA